VEFYGDVFADPKLPELKADVTVSPGSILSVRTFVSPARKTFRVQFDIDVTGQTASELRLVLESAGKPFSETWLYRWTP
jgi:glucans biosynthesis protein